MHSVNCEACGVAVNLPPETQLCNACKIQEIEVFRRVRDYVYDHPGCNAKEIARGTGINERVLLRFIRQGRLKLKSGE